MLPHGSESEKLALIKSEMWNAKASGMIRGGSSPSWYNTPTETESLSDEMTYECDSGLGSPTVADCSSVEWAQLGPASDTLSVGPNTIFLHSNTCYLAISATITVVLIWQQIQAALAALMNTCVQHPYQPPQGGRAYYGSHRVYPSGRKNKRQSNFTGLDALPPHVNLTLFEQLESWTGPTDELNSCTWKAVVQREPVSPCNPR